MKRTLIACFALMTLTIFACGSRRSDNAVAPKQPVGSDATTPRAEAVGSETNSFLNDGSCREFTFPRGYQAWAVNKTLCSNLRGIWKTGECPTDKALASCTKAEGGNVDKMFCYGEIMPCRIACQDSGQFKQF